MPDMQLYPLKFEPIYKHRIWGGRKLQEVFGKDLPEGEKIGESWELADLGDDKSIIANGELAGFRLNEAVAKHTEEITGCANFTLPFPLLIKFLDAADILSVQVHPDEQTCRKLGAGEPKNECWYIISAEPGAVIYKGLKAGVTKEDFAGAIKKGTAEQMLQQVPVRQGECHFLPAGTVHSIGAGLLAAEIQTPSDTTYRVFDFNRVDADGKPRPLHIEEALESIHFDLPQKQLAVTTTGRLVDCGDFVVDKAHQSKGCEMLLSYGKAKIMIFIRGGGQIAGTKRTVTPFKAGDCILIPAAFKGAAQFAQDSEYLTVTLTDKE